jgi:uncharacterized protein
LIWNPHQISTGFRILNFWGTHTGAELDLFFLIHGRRYGIEIKFSDAPKVTRSMQTAIETLSLNHLWIIYPGDKMFPVHEKITLFPARNLPDLGNQPAFLSN